jgi:hypothetical protein
VGWEFDPHTTLLKEARREGVEGRGTPAKSAKERKSFGFKEELENNCYGNRNWKRRL